MEAPSLFCGRQPRQPSGSKHSEGAGAISRPRCLCCSALAGKVLAVLGRAAPPQLPDSSCMPWGAHLVQIQQ